MYDLILIIMVNLLLKTDTFTLPCDFFSSQFPRQLKSLLKLEQPEVELQKFMFMVSSCDGFSY